MTGPGGGVPPSSASAVARCGAAPVDVPQLASYWDAAPPRKFWLDMRHDRAWEPAAQLAMPYHHASRLELTNLAAFPALDALRDRRVRFTIEITGREIEKRAHEDEWLATYAARIAAVCVP